jgi:hypothetical protein
MFDLKIAIQKRLITIRKYFFHLGYYILLQDKTTSEINDYDILLIKTFQ